MTTSNERAGTGTGQTPAAIDDVLMEEQQERFNALREMMVMSKIPDEFVARGVISAKESTDIIRMVMLHDLANTGVWNHNLLLWMKLALSVSVEGRGRSEAVSMYGGFGAALKQVQRRMGFGGGGEGSGNDGNQPRRQ